MCQTAKPRVGCPPGLMQSVESKSPWQIVACDIMGPYPRSPRGNCYLFVVTDHFTKWVELFPLRTVNRPNVWRCLMEVFSRFGFPAQLITDNATYFTSKLFEDNCRAVGVKHKRTTTYHPQTNITERVNRNLKAMLIAHTEQHKDWDAKLPEIAFATRTTVNRSTGFTPAYLNYGREMPFPLDRTLPETEAGSGLSPHAVAVRQRLRDAIQAAREQLDVARLQQAEQYNRCRRDVQFAVGDMVLRRTHPLSDASRKFAASLAPKWEGPFTVSEKLSSITYLLRHSSTGEHAGPVNIADLKQYHVD